MRQSLYVLLILVIGGGVFALVWFSHHKAGQVSSSTSSNIPHPVNTAANHPPTQAPPSDPHLVTEKDWEQLRAARLTALQTNPDLAAEYKHLMDEMKAQQAKFDAAMIKADPKVAPLVAKLVALRDRTMARNSTATPDIK